MSNSQMKHEKYALYAETANFKLSEFHSHDGVQVPAKYCGNVQDLMNQLEVLRKFLGVPIKINSGYRSPQQNKKVGGVSNSMHLVAKAADIVAVGKTPKEVQGAIKQLIAAGKMRNGGLGEYADFTHYDIGEVRRWK